MEEEDSSDDDLDLTDTGIGRAVYLFFFSHPLSLNSHCECGDENCYTMVCRKANAEPHVQPKVPAKAVEPVKAVIAQAKNAIEAIPDVKKELGKNPELKKELNDLKEKLKTDPAFRAKIKKAVQSELVDADAE